MSFRLHVLGLPHTRTSREFNACAYTSKVLRFCSMMSNVGHEVIHYGAEGSNPACAERVSVISESAQRKFFGPEEGRIENSSGLLSYDPGLPYWSLFNERCAQEIRKRIQPRDFLCVIGGTAQKPVSDMVGEENSITVEYGVGYYGTFARFKCFESYTHQSACYAMRSSDPDGSLYDCVIPNYFAPEDFPMRTLPIGGYLLYIGRLTSRKGVRIAVETAKATGITLVIAGGGEAEPGLDLGDKFCTRVGHATVEQRAELMRKAVAVIAPTTYMEPFGGAAVEAQLCGTPAITTDQAAFSETVEHGVTGFRCHTLAQFVEAVGECRRLDPKQIRSRAIDKYSMGAVAPQFDRWFRMLYGLWGSGWHELGPDAVRDL